MNKLYSMEYWNSLNNFDATTLEDLKMLAASFWRDKREDTLFARRSAGAAALAFIDRIGVRTSSDETALRMQRYELCFRLRRWDDIIQCYRQRTAFSGTVDAVIDVMETYYAGAAYMAISRRGDGEPLLRSLPEKLRPSVRKHVDELLAVVPESNDGDYFCDLANSVVQALMAGQFDRALALCRQVYEEHDVKITSYAGLATVLRLLPPTMIQLDRLADIAAGFRTPSNADEAASDETSLVFVCGFGWSGSGAVTDFLKDFHGVSTALNTQQELVWTQGRQSMVGIHDCLCSAPGVQGLREFLCGTLLGLPSLRSSLTRSERSFRLQRSMLGFVRNSPVLIEKFAVTAGKFVLALSQCHDIFDFRGAFMRLLSGAIAPYADGQALLLVNNGLLAGKFSLAQFIPRARFIVVRRNALDAYCARRLESNSSERLTPDIFMSHRRKVESAYAAGKDALFTAGSGMNLLEINFEDFVQFEDSRRRVLDFLGLDAQDRKSRSEPGAGAIVFDAAQSMRNIGIHRVYSNRDEIEKLEHLLAI